MDRKRVRSDPAGLKPGAERVQLILRVIRIAILHIQRKRAFVVNDETATGTICIDGVQVWSGTATHDTSTDGGSGTELLSGDDALNGWVIVDFAAPQLAQRIYETNFPQN